MHLCAQWVCRCHNRRVRWLGRCPKCQRTTYLWTGLAHSADGHERKLNPTIPAHGCDSWITTTPRLPLRRPFRAAFSTVKCTCALPKERGCMALKHGWPFCVYCPDLPGLAGSPACRPFVGWALPCMDSSRGTVTVSPARPRVARAILALSPLRGPSEARAHAA